MRKLLVLSAAALLCATGAGAEAAPKPVPMTFYFHGTHPLGEADRSPVTDGFGDMDTTKPTGSQSKSKQITNYVAGPNATCAGNSYWPFWVGSLSGEVTGSMTISLSTLSHGGSFEVRVFQDVDAQACNDDSPKVAGSTTVKAPSGTGSVEAVIKKLKLKPKSSFMVQLQPVGLTTDQTRVFYDSAADASSVSFSCIPKAGKKTC